MLEQHMFTMKTFYSTGGVVYCIVYARTAYVHNENILFYWQCSLLYCNVVYFHICKCDIQKEAVGARNICMLTAKLKLLKSYTICFN
jgi:hypothetical protein